MRRKYPGDEILTADWMSLLSWMIAHLRRRHRITIEPYGACYRGFRVKDDTLGKVKPSSSVRRIKTASKVYRVKEETHKPHQRRHSR